MEKLLISWGTSQGVRIRGERKGDNNVYYFANISGENVFIGASDQSKETIIENLNRISLAYFS